MEGRDALNHLNFKLALKWTFFLFCIITTIQLIQTATIGGLLSGVPFGQVVFCRQCLLEFILIALAGALPLLILVDSKFLSWIPFNVRRALHFLLTFGAMCGLLIYWGWQDVSVSLLFPFALFLATYILATFFFKKYILARHIAQQNAEKQKQLQYYTEELERYQLGVRKFQHDYQNILLSLDAYIADGDLADLRQYYYSSFRPTFDSIVKDDFSAER